MTDYEMSGKPYSQKSGLKNHTNERIFQVMTLSVCHLRNEFNFRKVHGIMNTSGLVQSK